MKKLLYPALLVLLLLGSTQARAADGCKVLLCLAGNWRNISECRPPVEEAMRDVARGRGWPTCGMSGAGNTANFNWISQADCPVFYQDFGFTGGDGGSVAYTGCRGYDAIIKLQVSGSAWLDLFWSFSGTQSSTRYYPPARAALGTNIDPTYDNDATAYVPPSPQPSCTSDNC